jgi:hypothetical protein
MTFELNLATGQKNSQEQRSDDPHIPSAMPTV